MLFVIVDSCFNERPGPNPPNVSDDGNHDNDEEHDGYNEHYGPNGRDDEASTIKGSHQDRRPPAAIVKEPPPALQDHGVDQCQLPPIRPSGVVGTLNNYYVSHTMDGSTGYFVIEFLVDGRRAPTGLSTKQHDCLTPQNRRVRTYNIYVKYRHCGTINT